MKTIAQVIKEAETIVTPTGRERSELISTAESIMKKVEAAASRFGEVSGVMLGGSFAKETWLPHDVDIDVFVKIAPSVGEVRFEFVGLSVGREASRGYPHGKKYAQHPYTEATIRGVRVNIVPCYDVKPGQWKSAADRSPYHVDFVKNHLDGEARTQVRLLKKFMKVVGVYGAEIENEGFSGYATEVLVHLHGSFEGVLRYFAGLGPARGRLLSLGDPIDDERDLSKAISTESVTRMVLAARAFIAEPRMEFFKRVRVDVRRDLRSRLYAIRFRHRRLSEDTLWGELKKSTKQVVKSLEARGFSVSRAAACSDNSDESAIIILPETETLPELEERVGPGVELESEVKRFVEKNESRARLVWAGEDGRVHILQRREGTVLSRVLEQLVKSQFSSIGASREIALAVKKNGRLIHGATLIEEGAKLAWFREGADKVVTDTIGTHRTR